MYAEDNKEGTKQMSVIKATLLPNWGLSIF